MADVKRMLAVLPVVGAVVAAFLFVAVRDADQLSEEDQAPVVALGDVEAALRWRAQAEANSAPYQDIAEAEQLGYWRLYDSSYGPWEHLIKWDAIEDDRILDTTEPEVLVYRADGGEFELQAFAFALPERYNSANTANIAGGSGVWHTHPTICIKGDPFENPANGRLSDTLADTSGNCPVGVRLPSVLMVHAWVVENDCGPFAPALSTTGIDAIFQALNGVDADGDTPGCDPELARRVWGE